ncbi:GPR1/FUN34/yaaH family-domain-containing protein [Zychaea mexicana]|uniref:GPR1/FUN34/yaaH family-domain-containing protein n=1 Tax=Zychaea mexicana TaxID=64656 RepID=UPI0022FE2FFD|nr:GPR1/FUN34/yaaH family-domain-containing protein [Zychaea mexicana]KAI9499684.1 GPR1/FUN34/yaaH family-domain-containing protein [Zychaea mexicana]
MSAEQDIEAKYQASTPAPVVAAPVTIANPGPLGLCGFALTTLVLSLHNASAGMPTGSPNNVVVGLAFFYGGLVQLLAGMWEFRTGNTFGATAFSSYGGFWLSYAIMFIPGANIQAAYDDHPGLLAHSLGIYLTAWAIFTALMLIAAHRSSVAMIALFFCLTITFILLAAADFHGSNGAKVAGGALGVVTACIAWYNALAGLLTKESSYFLLPTGPLS